MINISKIESKIDFTRFRMLRIFKLAKKFPSMKILLSAGVQTLMSMGDFVALPGPQP